MSDPSAKTSRFKSWGRRTNPDKREVRLPEDQQGNGSSSPTSPARYTRSSPQTTGQMQQRHDTTSRTRVQPDLSNLRTHRSAAGGYGGGGVSRSAPRGVDMSPMIQPAVSGASVASKKGGGRSLYPSVTSLQDSAESSSGLEIHLETPSSVPHSSTPPPDRQQRSGRRTGGRPNAEASHAATNFETSSSGSHGAKSDKRSRGSKPVGGRAANSEASHALAMMQRRKSRGSHSRTDLRAHSPTPQPMEPGSVPVASTRSDSSSSLTKSQSPSSPYGRPTVGARSRFMDGGGSNDLGAEPLDGRPTARGYGGDDDSNSNLGGEPLYGAGRVSGGTTIQTSPSPAPLVGKPPEGSLSRGGSDGRRGDSASPQGRLSSGSHDESSSNHFPGRKPARNVSGEGDRSSSAASPAPLFGRRPAGKLSGGEGGASSAPLFGRPAAGNLSGSGDSGTNAASPVPLFGRPAASKLTSAGGSSGGDSGGSGASPAPLFGRPAASNLTSGSGGDSGTNAASPAPLFGRPATGNLTSGGGSSGGGSGSSPAPLFGRPAAGNLTSTGSGDSGSNTASPAPLFGRPAASKLTSAGGSGGGDSASGAASPAPLFGRPAAGNLTGGGESGTSAASPAPLFGRPATGNLASGGDGSSTTASGSSPSPLFGRRPASKTLTGGSSGTQPAHAATGNLTSDGEPASSPAPLFGRRPAGSGLTGASGRPKPAPSASVNATSSGDSGSTGETASSAAPLFGRRPASNSLTDGSSGLKPAPGESLTSDGGSRSGEPASSPAPLFGRRPASNNLTGTSPAESSSSTTPIAERPESSSGGIRSGGLKPAPAGSSAPLFGRPPASNLAGGSSSRSEAEPSERPLFGRPAAAGLTGDNRATESSSAPLFGRPPASNLAGGTSGGPKPAPPGSEPLFGRPPVRNLTAGVSGDGVSNSSGPKPAPASSTAARPVSGGVSRASSRPKPAPGGRPSTGTLNGGSSTGSASVSSSPSPLFGRPPASTLASGNSGGRTPASIPTPAPFGRPASGDLSANTSSSQPLFGRPSKRGTLEDDIPDSAQAQHSILPGSSGATKGGLLDDSDSEDDEEQERMRTAMQLVAAGDKDTGLAIASVPVPSTSRSNSGEGPFASLTQERNTRQVSSSSRRDRAQQSLSTVREDFSSPGPRAVASASDHSTDRSGSPFNQTGPRGGTAQSFREEPKEKSVDVAKGKSTGLSEEDMLNAAIAESKRTEESKRQQSSAADVTLSQDDIEDAKGNARTIRDLCKNDDVDVIFLQSVLKVCKQDQEKIAKSIEAAFQREDADVDFELLDLNSNILDAIETGENTVKSFQKKAPETKKTANLEIPVLVDKKDIFSLICMLRAQQNERRLEAALALMKFARDAEIVGGEDNYRLREEIRSSGGMQSLLTVCRTRDSKYELKVVAAVAVAYLLPSFVNSSTQAGPSFGLKIMECFRFLSTARSVTPNSETVTKEESFKASAVGLTTFWINMLEPMLNSDKSRGPTDGETQLTSSVSLGRSSSKGGRLRNRAAGGGVFDQRQESIQLQELLEMTVSLIIHNAEQSSEKTLPQEGDSVFTWRYALVEQVCAVELARPIAVRDGILRILVNWIGSKDPEKIRPAAQALRSLTSIKDKYMAGWIHSQMVNEGALEGIVTLTRDFSVGHDVRLAIAQILSSLCVAPHTRAAVVEANCINFLIGFLYEHSDSGSREVALFFAGSALVQLAAGAITRASVFDNDDIELQGFGTADKQHTLVDDIVESGAIVAFVAMAQEHRGRLRSVAVEALRVLSEDISPIRQTRLQLCEDGAARALGLTLKDGLGELTVLLKEEDAASVVPQDPLKETHEALCALANILDPVHDGTIELSPQQLQGAGHKDARQLLIKGCLETAESGGLESLLKIASIPFSKNSGLRARNQKMDLLQETCRSLASISPLLLSEDVATAGYARWSDAVLTTFCRVLARLIGVENVDHLGDDVTEVCVSVLQGVGALATSEPLKVRIVDKVLPSLLQAKSDQDRADMSNAAGQAFQSLDFTEDEVAVQVAGNNPNLLADWFCLQRSLLFQAMVRSEIRQIVFDAWNVPFRDAKNSGLTGLIREVSDASRSDGGSSVGLDLFDSFASDESTAETRESILHQYSAIYDCTSPLPAICSEHEEQEEGDDGLLVRQIYPLNSSEAETDWILKHRQECIAMEQQGQGRIKMCLSNHVEKFLDYCFPSRLLRDQVLPVFDLRPDSSFNFRVAMMPQRLYFSFRREGQLLSQLCDNEASSVDAAEVHWTLGFTNSSFAGEFAESLVQALYLCPMVQGLSFARNEDWPAILDADKENKREEGGGLLVNLAGSLPPWISYLTFDGILNDRDLKALVGILETMGKLSAGANPNADVSEWPRSRKRDRANVGQERFGLVAIRRSPHLTREAWLLFFGLFGRVGTPPARGLSKTPFSTLRNLDLSGNLLGDSLCAVLLELAHNQESGCSLEQLDLSGNRIQAGTSVMKVLRCYVEDHRYNQTAGMKKNAGRGWKSPLLCLNLSGNDLHAGNAWLEIIALLKHNALELKTLDLSFNGLTLDVRDYEYSEVVVSSLQKNSCLCRLNLSHNKFTAATIDHILRELSAVAYDSGMAFLQLEGNMPPLSEDQRSILSSFSMAARTSVLERYVNEEMNETDRNHSYDSPGMTGPLRDDTHAIPEEYGEPEREVSDLMNDEPPEQTLAGPGENMITVLFSAPLVFTDGNRNHRPFAKLDFKMERELMWQCLKEASRDIELSFDSATHDRLLATMTKRCTCLHYSGHGHEHYLPFEDGSGGPNWFRVEDIKNLIEREGSAPFRFVFVSACHSGLAGETFASAGVPHVVCCQQEFELKDTAALQFTRQFYLALAVGRTVKDSFEQGCRAVRATPNLRDAEKEMRKFVLLPADGNHDVPIFNARPVAEWPRPADGGLSARRPSRYTKSKSMLYVGGAKSSELSVRNMMQEDPSPSPPQFFLGREVDTYYVLKAILSKRLVSVVGETGIGRSSLVCSLCHYINERASTIIPIDRIYFVRVKQGRRQRDRFKTLVLSLSKMLVEAGKAHTPEDDSDMETRIDTICSSLKNDKALVIFDRVEYLEDSDEASEFPMLLDNLFRETRDVKVLITARQPLGIPSLGGTVEVPLRIGPLNLTNTVKLFSNLCPYLHTPAERMKLMKAVLTDGEEAELFPSDPSLSEATKKIFEILGDGVPSRVEKAAYGVSKDDFMALMNGDLFAEES